jgi:hypothetical protein
MCSVIVKTKSCGKCRVEKDVTEFSKNKTSKDGLQNRCKECVKQYDKQYKKDNADKMKQYYKNNADRFTHSIPAGIYEVLYKGIRKYVGQSKQPYHRLSIHFSKRSNPENALLNSIVSYKLSIGEIKREHLSFNILEFEDDEQRRLDIEQRYIDNSTGLWNVVGQKY